MSIISNGELVLSVLAALSSFCAEAGLAQVPPESMLLCGGKVNAKSPRNITVTFDQSNGVSYVHFDLRGATKTLTMGAVDRVQALCLLPGNNVAVFGELTAGAPVGYHAAIVDLETGAVVDSWDAYTPVMSPDQRWIILRNFTHRKAA